MMQARSSSEPSRLIGVFDHEADVLNAVKRLRRDGLTIENVFTPYAVHGLDEAAGLRRSRLGWVCAVAGLSAAGSMLFFQSWVSAIDWPINVGGKPFFSIPAFIPVTFELGVLAGGLCTVFAFLLISRLFPGKQVELVHPRVTDDRFVVVVRAPGAGATADRVAELFRLHHASEIESGGMR